jgi:hypothetical protein
VGGASNVDHVADARIEGDVLVLRMRDALLLDYRRGSLAQLAPALGGLGLDVVAMPDPNAGCTFVLDVNP